ncbi:MAG: FAD-dependent oxidoreductase [Planctomycetes bacterium]|nr:FAD-dependent oxidoreductase [Planctomycetota bacterium]
MTRGRVIVVGGGVIGAACAHWLVQEGWQVEVIDRGEFGAACSARNCGLIAPSHVLPLAMPGAIRATLPMLLRLRGNAPLTIRPRLDPNLFSWLARFALSCRADQAWRSAVALHGLLTESRRQYERLATDDGLNAEWTPGGCMVVYDQEQHWEEFAATNAEIGRHCGFEATRIDAGELTRREPALVDGLGGAWLFECDGHLDPGRLMSAWRDLLKRRGVAVREHCELTGIDGAARRATRILTTQGPLEADALVIATGSWTPLLARMLGVRLPIQPGKGYSLTVRRPEMCIRTPMIFESARVAITPFAAALRVGSTMEFAGYDAELRPKRLELLRRAARRYLRSGYDPTGEEPWYGWRPMTPDGLPFIDLAPRYDNVWLAAGHNMIGTSAAPSTGRLICELVSALPPHVDPAPFRLEGRVT